VFRHAVATLRASGDPTVALRGAIKSPKVQHHAAITDPRKLGDLLRALWGYQGGFVVASVLKLAPLVFTRPGELRHAEWAEIDLDAATWCIPAHKMEMRAAHIVPLSTQAVTILRDLYALTGCGRYVFPSPRPKRPMSVEISRTEDGALILRPKPRTAADVFALARAKAGDAFKDWERPEQGATRPVPALDF
ncbi:MAG: tyrosine-type recombinase/integrase, partial [Metallibacterium sp.]